MSLKKRCSSLITAVLCLAACSLYWSGTVWAASGAAKDKGEKREPAPTLIKGAAIPEVRRIAVFQDEAGEQILRSPLSMVRDGGNGDLVVTNLESGEVVILDKSGSLVKRLGKETGLVSPYGVALDEKGTMYLSELRTGLVKVLSPIGAVIDEFDLSEAMGKKVTPGRITLGKDRLLYIADLTHNEILIFDLKGKFVRALGPFDYLQKAGPDGAGGVIGVSAQGKGVKFFAADGALLHSFGDHGDSSETNISFPTSFAVDARKRVWIADAFQHRLKVLSPEGEFLFNIGKRQEKNEGFFFPVDLCFGDNGELFVLEKGASRIQIFQVEDLKGVNPEKK